MFTLISVLKTKTQKLGWEHSLVFADDNPNLILWDGDLDFALQDLGFEIQENGNPVADGELLIMTRKILGSSSEGVVVRKIGGDQYVDFSGVYVTAEEWLHALDYIPEKFDIVEVNYYDKKTLAEEKRVELDRWVYVLFGEVPRLHILGVDGKGNIIEEIQVPDDTITDEPVDEIDYQDWLNDAKKSGVMSNFR